MAELSPEQFVEKHNRKLKGGLEDMRIGVGNIKVAPTAQAAEKAAKMKARLVAKIDDGTWAKRLKAVSLEDWRSKMLDKGIGRVSGGIDAAADKMRSFAAQLLPATAAIKRKVATMPDLTLEDSLSRMNFTVREMAKFRKA